MTDPFSSTYREGRSRFCAAAHAAGGTIESFVMPDRAGPVGEELAIDAVRFGAADAQRLLLTSCGLHGLEAAGGSAAMVNWLMQGGASRLPDGVAVVLVHPLNPFGWAYASRGNEDGIDLNRNALDWSAPIPTNLAYETLHPIVIANEPDTAGLAAFSGAFAALARQHGMEWALGAVASGQYAFPDGLSFGGAEQAWSTQVAKEIAEKHKPNRGRTLILDWHTGIGPWAEPFFILDAARDSADHRLVSSWWPDRSIHCDDVVEGASIAYRGVLADRLRREIEEHEGGKALSLTVEWGTYDIDRMVEALLMDNWLRHRAGGAPERQDWIREQLIERFIPSDPRWRDAVIEGSEAIFEDAILAVSSWH
ncbi:DUF2817 domain-containing protein [Alteriqipengyuania lutimaris]|uniref:DUF2817 domain-containing protein n=1 Tax=Alteriqipengyuania lutimaris TaxID=1538146 RepID=UPI0015F1538F|nr:DUF2817 domain-containing protein [Alteriqipengyuania lutimaris]MBB3034863.1 hypothetical protein [Alteriqipengyuania lutimaris]